jgi:DNA-binding MarR family transcriptional regulator
VVTQETKARVLDMSRYVPGMITHLSNKLSRGASALYRQHFGVGIIEWRIMVQLAVAPGSSARAICATTGLDKAAVSRSFEVLKAKRLVGFAGGDSREQPAHLTAAGHRLHDRIIDVALERERRLLACLSGHEQSMLVALLNRIDANLEAVEAPHESLPRPRATGRRKAAGNG